MCGIAGFWEPSAPSFEPEGVLRDMCRAMRLRGPDASGTLYDSKRGLGLAHAPLSIIDLSEAGAQPMESADSSLCMVYNGEVYNYRDLRSELEADGLAPESGWRGGSDTEVVLQAVRAWGLEKAIARFVGMFAFALYDREKERLHLVRDRMGIKPLYYGLAGASLVFGSTLAPLERHPAFEGSVDRNVLPLLLRHLYIPAPWSIYESVNKLEPGCMVSLSRQDLERGRLAEPVRWWDLGAIAAKGLETPFWDSEEEAADALEEALTEAVRLRMIADVDLGAFLSGGVDSSAVVALMQKISNRPARTFTIGFSEKEYDEAAHAREVAAHLSTDHTELILTPADALRTIPELPEHFDEPFADSSQIPTLLVSRLARRHVTVSLSGDGGDELFGGYTRYTWGPAIWKRISRLPGGMRRSASGLMQGGLESLLYAAYRTAEPLLPRKSRQRIFRDKLQKLTAALPAQSREEFFRSLASYWQETETAVPGAVPRKTRFTDPAAWPAISGFPQWMMAMDQLTYLPDDILTKTDRASMAVSLEARVPVIDHRVVELSWRLPLSMKIGVEGSKHLLKKVLYRHVPRELIERPKQGFALPIDAWLRNELRDWAEELLSKKALSSRGFFDPKAVRSLFEEHLAGRRNYQHHLWPVLMFQAWAGRRSS